jgi:hypothetical protein
VGKKKSRVDGKERERERKRNCGVAENYVLRGFSSEFHGSLANLLMNTMIPGVVFGNHGIRQAEGEAPRSDGTCLLR